MKMSQQRWLRWAGIPVLAILTVYGIAVGQRIRLEAPSPTPILLDRHGEFLAQFGVILTSDTGVRRTEYGYWTVDDLPERVAAATIALEDQRFWTHPGVDPLAALRAAGQAVGNGHIRSGASTLAMQIVRMQHPAPRTWWNKLVEAGAALVLTQRYGRDALLRHYLRMAPYGNGSHGIAHAARWYFAKPVSDLSWAEIAFLTAIPQAPGRMNPYQTAGRHAIVQRGLRLLERLTERGVISPGDRRLAKAQLQMLQPVEPGRRPPWLHAVLYLERLLERNGLPPHRQPLERATLDLALQRDIARQIEALWPQWQELGADQVAVLVVDRIDFAVRAAIGSHDYFQTPAGAVDFIHTPRSPGSTLKPFLYALALEQGLITPNAWLPDQPEGTAGIGNADGRFLGLLRPRQALANSRNVPAIYLLRRVGLHPFLTALADLDVLIGPGHRNPSEFGLTLAIGGLPTTLARLVRAYGALVNEGELPALRWYEGQPGVAPRRMWSATTARHITSILADPQARLPSFPRYGPTDYPFAVALKTGTSQGYRDAWIVAYSADALIGVWLGRSDAEPMRGLTGGQAPAALARTILLNLHRNQPGDLHDERFPLPDGYLPLTLCLDADASPDRCGRTLQEWLPAAQLTAPTVPHPPAIAGLSPEAPIEITIVAPESNARLWRNPEAPPALNRIALKATVRGPVSQIVWYVDDAPFGMAAVGQPLYWPLQQGVHRFEARLPYREERSRLVRVVVE